MTLEKNSAGSLLLRAFTFNASNHEVRTVAIDGEPYFVAKDVCCILDISNHIDALSRLDDDEKSRSVLPTQFGDKETNLVNESGLYHLIFQSRKPEAKAFRKWVTSEVLPALHRTGRYELMSADGGTEVSVRVLPSWNLHLEKIIYTFALADLYSLIGPIIKSWVRVSRLERHLLMPLWLYESAARGLFFISFRYADSKERTSSYILQSGCVE